MMVTALSNKIRLARIAAVGFALVAVMVVVFAPLYSSGGTLVQENGSLPLLLASAATVVVAIPLILTGEAARRTALIAGVVLALSSFVTVLGIFILPAALLLIYSGLAARE